MIDLYRKIKEMSHLVRFGFASVTDRGMNLVLLSEQGEQLNAKQEEEVRRTVIALIQDDGVIGGDRELRILLTCLRRHNSEDMEVLGTVKEEAVGVNRAATETLTQLDAVEPSWCSYHADYHPRNAFWADHSSKKLGQTNSFCIEGHNDHQSRWSRSRSRKQRNVAEPMREAA